MLQEEVPPTNSQATGMSESTAAGGGIEYAIDASNIQGVTAGTFTAVNRAKTDQ